MKFLFSALLLLLVAAIFAGAISYLAQIVVEMGITSLNFTPLDFPR